MGCRKKIPEDARAVAEDRENLRVQKTLLANFKATVVNGTVTVPGEVEDDHATTDFRALVREAAEENGEGEIAESTVTNRVRLLEEQRYLVGDQRFLQTDPVNKLKVLRVSSGNYYLNVIVPQHQSALRASIDWAAYGCEDGRGNKKTR